MANEFQYRQTGNMHGDPTTPPTGKSGDFSWKTVSIETIAMDGFEWEVLCEEKWVDPVNRSYECYRITRRCKAMGGRLYSTSTHITPLQQGRPSGNPSISESLIWGPDNSSDD